MKIVQSYWTKPAFSSSRSYQGGRRRGGWRQVKYCYMSWALSCLLLKRQYNVVELVTDSKGKEILIDLLELPYDSVKVVLNVLDEYPETLWAVGKLYAYSLQKEPFLHVDGDVFIWKRFGSSLEYSDLVCQNEEVDFPHDIAILKKMRNTFDFLPDAIEREATQRGMRSVNAGVFGGTHVPFLQDYTRQAFDFINANANKLSEINLDQSNTIFEQYLFACLARLQHIEVSYILHNIGRHYIKYLCDFVNGPYKTKYIHIIGPYKKQASSEHWLEERLRLEFPAVYYKIISLAEKFVL